MFALNRVDVNNKTDFLQKIREIMKNKRYDDYTDLMITRSPLSFDVLNLDTCVQQVVTMNCEENESEYFIQQILNEVKKHNWREINFQ
jgi:hypothetical protein